MSNSHCYFNKLILIILVNLLLSGLYVQNASAQVSNWQKAASIVPKSPSDFSSVSYKQSLRDLAATGINQVALIVPYYQSNQTSTDIKAGGNTPTDASLREGIQYAKSLGLEVILKPHPEISNGGWRGNIDPSDRSAWFSAYGNILNHLADIASEEGVQQLVIGTELRKMTSEAYNQSNTQHWKDIIANIKERYSGELTYSAQWSSENKLDEKFNIKFWDQLDYLGVSAYWPLAQSESNPSLESLVSSWNSIEQNSIGPWQKTFNKPLLFTEIGYRSIEKANQDPFEFSRSGQADPALQARLYEALITYWNSKGYFKGINWWEWETNPNAGGPGSTSYTPQNKEAEQVLVEYFKNGNTLPANPGPSDPPAGTTYSVSGTGSPSSPEVNKAVEITSNVKASNNITSAIVDIEIYDSKNKKIYQKYFPNQNLAVNTNTPFKFSWTPPSSGTYTVKTGIFTNNWSSLLYWNNNVYKLGVGETAKINELDQTGNKTLLSTEYSSSVKEVDKDINSSIKNEVTQGANEIEEAIGQGEIVKEEKQNNTDTNNSVKAANPDKAENNKVADEKVGEDGENKENKEDEEDKNQSKDKENEETEYSIEIWWPESDAVLYKEQEFKALVKGISPKNYDLYWQIEGEDEEKMSDENDPYPHKKDKLNIKEWDVEPGSTVTITFIAKDEEDNVIAEKAVEVKIEK